MGVKGWWRSWSSGVKEGGGVKGWGSRWVRVWLGSRGGIYI